MVPEMKHFIIPPEKDLEIKQHIIIFSVNQLTRIKANLCLSYKTNTENMQDSFSKFIQSMDWEVRDWEDLGSYP